MPIPDAGEFVRLLADAYPRRQPEIQQRRMAQIVRDTLHESQLEGALGFILDRCRTMPNAARLIEELEAFKPSAIDTPQPLDRDDEPCLTCHGRQWRPVIRTEHGWRYCADPAATVAHSHDIALVRCHCHPAYPKLGATGWPR